ncbi:protein of unknown function [Pseudomonas reinekei]|uniref:DUF4297 domain-containing protein n=1 Tax=Pseudomonas reinekei TaxID=395598 RepID=A0A1H0JCU2_PSERE|nr:dsDNA nuclease domain-containing protein [Pseudomonas reinekei]KAB0483814.1 DUF4297 domain-containing protein [Pseudomonas reinekei]OLU00877.1 hypothetical protein BVK86_20315 [Pseudomonas reinekei]SDO41605.1 protein of unknown function [Pseudomonas reinekei]
MVSIPSPSNKGGPAARQGFKYQDHVAVTFILKMLRDSTYLQVECETADDIVAISQQAGETVNEYIQVKTTENDKKWNLTESIALEKQKADSSLFQKSLKCDVRPGLACFRIVSKRDIAKALEYFTKALDKRVKPDAATDRGQKLAKKFPKSVSARGRDFTYWADHFVWQVCGDVASLEATNLRMLAEVIDLYGESPSHRQQKDIYEAFLSWADDAATADVKTAPEQKIITRIAAFARLKALLDVAAKHSASFAKPYKSKPDPFLVEFHTTTEDGLLRSLSGFDVEYDFEEWRGHQLAEHLMQWLPEFCLRASEIANFQVHHTPMVLAKSINTLNNAAIPRDRLIAELILHTILRSRENSEPIACKVFYAVNGKLSEFGNAHIVQQTGQADQLWLGLSRMISTGTMDQTLKEICDVLDATISRAALTEEREVIIALREPHHHLPTAEAFNKALHRNAPAQDMLNVMCFPILLAYDSEALSGGYLSDYLTNLKAEVTLHYNALASTLPPKIKQVRVVVFLVPIESIHQLVQKFNTLCKAAS